MALIGVRYRTMETPIDSRSGSALAVMLGSVNMMPSWLEYPTDRRDREAGFRDRQHHDAPDQAQRIKPPRTQPELPREVGFCLQHAQQPRRTERGRVGDRQIVLQDLSGDADRQPVAMQLREQPMIDKVEPK